MYRILLLLLVISQDAFADNVKVVFDPPISRTDGTAIIPSEIAGYNVFVDGIKLISSQTMPPGTGEYTLHGDVSEFTIALDPGTYNLTMTAIDTGRRESAKSDSLGVPVNFPLNPPVMGVSVIVEVVINVEN